MGLETLETANVNQKDIVEKIRGLSPDIIVVVAFGQKAGPGDPGYPSLWLC